MTKGSLPQILPIKVDYSIFARELSQASLELGKLDLQRTLPNPNLLVSPLTLKEATVSSKIEGTRSTVSDVARYEAGEVAKYADTAEVANYRKAMKWAIESLKSREITLSFIKQLHGILLDDRVRGHLVKGKFREEQVYIGKEGTTIEEATYVPPEPLKVPEYMENLEEFINSYDGDDPIVNAAIIHYQFEAIHPFSDGNGRIGRLILPLYLYKKGLIYQPILYLSGYFERNRDLYVSTLNEVDRTKNFNEWIKFFCLAVRDQAIETRSLINKIEDLHKDIEKRTSALMSPYCSRFINFMFAKPIFKSSDVSEYLGLKSTRSTTGRIIKRFLELGIIVPVGEPDKKKAVYAFYDLLMLL